MNNIQDLIKKQVLELVRQGDIFKNTEGDEERNVSIQNKERQENKLFKTDLPKGKSYLIRELSRLRDSSQEAVENANAFSEFKKYMHVERKIQEDLEKILLKNKDHNSPNLILLCGSVGDGKSHLLAYLKKNKPELLNEYQIFNDATESFSPNKNAMETLEEILQDFSDQLLTSSNKKVILAINMGVLHNFIMREHRDLNYKRLSEFVSRSELFSQNITTCYSEGNFDLISFGDYHSYELTENGPQSSFFLTILYKIFSKTERNPFYLAYKEDLANGIRTMVHENYEFMQEEYVQKQIVNLIIQTLVKFKLVISARAFLNFISDIIIPDTIIGSQIITEFERIDQSLPSLLFRRKERSTILKAFEELDPIHSRSPHIDQLIIDLHTRSDWKPIVDSYIISDKGKKWMGAFLSQENLTDYTFTQFSETLIRMAYLTNKEFSQKIQEPSYQSYMKHLFYFNTGDRGKIKRFYEEFKSALFKWKGSPKKGYIYLSRSSDHYRLGQLLNIKPVIDHLKPNPKDILQSFKSSIVVGYHNGNSENRIFLEIDYPLYYLLLRVREGYYPNKKDEEDAIKFVEFVEKIMKFGEKKNELLVHFPTDGRFYKLKRDDFGAFVFEKE
ncbi:Uncharacterized protein BN1090_A2_01825 [Aneurinibacillus migulanus]|nr:Uncharacterized protein BN1090_A2_01825 [Aneurinibacillus migulanus]